MKDGKKNLELKKHVATIHSSNKLSLLQRKIANALLFNAYNDLNKKDEHEIHIRTLCNLIGYDSNDYKTIKKSLVNLLSTVIEWNLVDGAKVDSDGVWNASSIISDASIDGAICTYSYSNKMKKLLYHPELYGRLNMAVQAKFKSSYGLALYENCIRYQNIGQTPWLEFVNFRKLMGVEENKYKIFRDFKNRVLDKAVEEVNQYSPILIEPQFRKQKRQVTAIQFLINKSNTKNLTTQAFEQPELSMILKEQFGLSKKQIENILLNHEMEYIQQKISLIENSPSYKNNKIGNLAKYFVSAIQDDFQPIKGKNAEEKNINSDEFYTIQNQKKLEQQKKEAYRNFFHKQIIKYFFELSEKEKKSLIKEFAKFIGLGIYATIYNREGLSNLLIQDQLCVFIKHKEHKLLKKIISYEAFLQGAVDNSQSLSS